jgi:hypothetical protein
MTPQIDSHALLVILFWALMAPIAAYILIRVNGFLIDDYPQTFARAVGLAVATPVVMYLIFDLTAYLFILLMQDPDAGIRLPPGYSYWDWAREPFALKWRALGFLPFIRYIPVVTAVVGGAVMQVLIWRIPFQHGLLILVVQVFLNLCAMVLLSFVFRAGIDAFGGPAAPAGGTDAPDVRPPDPIDPARHPADLGEVCRRATDAAEKSDRLWPRLGRGWESVNGLLAPLYRLLEPVTRHFPVPVQDWLNAGGWVAVPLLLVIACYVIRRVRRSPPPKTRTRDRRDDPPVL